VRRTVKSLDKRYPALIDPRPRDGSLTLSEVHGPTLAIVCEECGRRGRYNVERLIAAHGDAKLTDLLTMLADYDKARSFSMYDRYKAVYEGLRCGLKSVSAR
jgi:hypothetical protein